MTKFFSLSTNMVLTNPEKTQPWQVTIDPPSFWSGDTQSYSGQTEPYDLPSKLITYLLIQTL